MSSSFLARSSTALLIALQLAGKATSYTLSDNFVGPSFLTGFAHDNIPDPTHGRVVYVDQNTAVAQNLTYAHGNSLVIRTDRTTVLNPSGPGRNSVRLRSNKQWSTSTTVLDVRHMPQGCGTWPAFWSFGDNWPANGEIDIIEGVNDQGANAATLHTSAGCTQPQTRAQTGTTLQTDCNKDANNNAGCGVRSTLANSYGPAFNNNGGGWYAMERTTTYIKVWFWPRNSGTVPTEVRNGATSVNPSSWGTPMALFVNDSCNIASHFGPHNIIINLTLCGDWAGQQSLYASAGCPGTCVDYVNNNPGAFTNAYWDIASLKVYV